MVLCDDTEGPARRANVYLQAPIDPKLRAFPPGEAFGAATDLDGAFTISNVPPGEYYVIAVYPGYISAREYVYPGAMSPEMNGRQEPLPPFVQRVRVVSGQTERVDIHLKRGGSISGIVTYSDGTPVPYVALTPKVKLSSGALADALGGASHADSAGHYRIDGLPDGSYAVLGGIDPGMMVPVFGGHQVGGSGRIIFAGGGMRPSKARIITVSAPEESTGVDIMVPLTGVHDVSGIVTAPDGHRLNHGLVRLFPTGERRFSLAAPLLADGSFSFHRLPPDKYTLSVEEASDFKMVPRIDGAVRYEQQTLVQNFGTASVELAVSDVDVTSVTLIVSIVR